MKTGSLLAVILFSMVAVTHLLRMLLGVQVTVEEWVLPMWFSIAGVLVPAAISYLLWKESG